MEILSVTGGRPLEGTIPIHGAKNSVLPILAACVVCQSPCVLHNCPDIEDVAGTIEILQRLGCAVSRMGSSILVDARGMKSCCVPAELAGKMRSSILFLGAIAARMGRAEIALPGGCPLGARPIDLHICALRSMGAEVRCTRRGVSCRADALHEARIELPFASVGATENILLAALRVPGVVQLCNAAREPEITDLIGFLRSAGARIEGAGTSELTVWGGEPLHGTTYTVLPDRIETATYLCAAAACGGDVTLTCTDAPTLAPVVEVLQSAGCEIMQQGSDLHILSRGRLKSPGRIVTGPYPGFPTDAQAPVMAALLRAEGETVFEETVFEDRLHHTAQFRRMGADICTCGQTALVRGVEALHGAALTAGDLRGGAAMVIAALACSENSFIFGVKHIKRGYDSLEGMLQGLGAEIKSVEI